MYCTLTLLKIRILLKSLQRLTCLGTFSQLLQELEALKETKGKADVQIAELQERVAQLTQDLDSAVTLSGQRLSQTVEAQQRITILEGELSSVKELFDKQVAQLQHFEKRCDVLISAECDYKARVAHLEDRLSTVLQDFSISRFVQDCMKSIIIRVNQSPSYEFLDMVFV